MKAIPKMAYMPAMGETNANASENTNRRLKPRFNTSP